MVLPESSSEDFFENDALSPPSDRDDTYDSDISHRIPWDRLPRSPFRSEFVFRSRLLTSLRAYEKLLRRPLTQSEMEITAYQRAKIITLPSYGYPLGLCYGILMYARHATAPGPPLANPGASPARRFPWLKGHAARNAWSGLRLSWHVLVGVQVAKALLWVYGGCAFYAYASSNPQARKIYEELATARAHPRATNPGAPARAAPESTATDGYQAASPISEMQDGYRSDEASPSDRMRGAPMPKENVKEPATRRNQDPFATGPREAPAQEDGATSPGSAWDRVRQRSALGKGPAGRGKPETRDGGGTSGPAQSDDDIQAAREQAQREFDERMEQERRGATLDAGKGGSDRW